MGFEGEVDIKDFVGTDILECPEPIYMKDLVLINARCVKDGSRVELDKTEMGGVEVRLVDLATEKVKAMGGGVTPKMAVSVLDKLFSCRLRWRMACMESANHYSKMALDATLNLIGDTNKSF